MKTEFSLEQILGFTIITLFVISFICISIIHHFSNKKKRYIINDSLYIVEDSVHGITKAVSEKELKKSVIIDNISQKESPMYLDYKPSGLYDRMEVDKYKGINF